MLTYAAAGSVMVIWLRVCQRVDPLQVLVADVC
jgi:hypothetical protein